jgi:Flp pilus assembly protein TadG
MVLNKSTSRSRARWMRRRKSRFRGAAAVEASLVIPIFLLAVFETIEFSRVNMIRSLAQDAAYEAARACMVDGATTAEATNRAKQILGLIGTRGVTVSINDGAGLTATSQVVKVSVNVPLTQNSLVLPWLFYGKQLKASTELKTERYNGFYQSN